MSAADGVLEVEAGGVGVRVPVGTMDLEGARRRLDSERVIQRILDRDHTVWKPLPEEIANRLGWLDLPGTMRPEVDAIEAFAADAARAFDAVVLLGMGGSSLGPEAFASIFDDAGGLPLTVVDTTDPDALLARLAPLDPGRTLTIVASKSGGTVETLSAFHWVHRRAVEHARAGGASEADAAAEVGRTFVAITDPGSGLEALARDREFRRVFLAPADVGGRFSALTCFGLVPAALSGIDVGRLLDRAAEEAEAPEGAALLGAFLAGGEAAGRDKLTVRCSSDVAPFADWIEQLVAESLGKEGRGVLPVVGEEAREPGWYADDRMFVALESAGGGGGRAGVAPGSPISPGSVEASGPGAGPWSSDALVAAGHPAAALTLRDRYDLGRQIVLWETATAVAGALMGVNPFDQPNVESAKVAARAAVERLRGGGTDGGTAATGHGDGIPAEESRDPAAALAAFLADAAPPAYVALQVYAHPDAPTGAAVDALRSAVAERTGGAVTVGWGPRFLHSTGQLHKGDAGNGRFVQILSTPGHDLDIPEPDVDPAARLSFGTLERAQADGDREALLDAGREVLRIGPTPSVAATLVAIVRSWRR